MGDIGAPELVIIGIIIVLLFGATRLPATAKGLGQALRLFKKEIRADDEPDKPSAAAPTTAAPGELTAVREQAPLASGDTAPQTAQVAPDGSAVTVEPHGVVTRQGR